MPPGHCMDSNSVLWDSSVLDLLMDNLELSEEEGAASLSNTVTFSSVEGAQSDSKCFFSPGNLVIWSSARFHKCSSVKHFPFVS